MPINYRTETGINQGINSFDLQQSTSTLSNENSTQTFISFLQSSSRFIEQIAANHSSLRAGVNEGGLAFVENSEGTQWLPYTIGGTYYPKGWYVWDGAMWVSSKSNIAETLDAIGSGSSGSSFSGDYNDLINTPIIPIDTNLSDGDIAALGYIKTDNNTQLSDADITALGYVKTSGTTMSFFQVQDDGVTGQTVTNGYNDAISLWDTPSLTSSDFSFDATSGVLTVNTAGVLEVDAKLVGVTTANNRVEMYIQLQKNGVELVSDAQYSIRSNNQSTGGAYIMGYKVNAAIGDRFKLRTKRVGVVADLGINNAANMSYFSAKLYI